MSDAFWMAFFGFLTSCVAIWQTRRNAGKIEEIHKNTNSMKDELVAAARSASHAEGLATGLAEGRAEGPVEIRGRSGQSIPPDIRPATGKGP